MAKIKNVYTNIGDPQGQALPVRSIPSEMKTKTNTTSDATKDKGKDKKEK